MISTILIILSSISLCLYKISSNIENCKILKKDNIYFLKFIFPIVIIFVHIPFEYQNPIQDIIGSFAYICVSWFCMISAYGLRSSLEEKSYYLDQGFKKRIISIFYPIGGGVAY